MPDQHIDVHPEAIRKRLRETGIGEQEHARWTAEHPPLPGLRWRISWGLTPSGEPQVRDRHLEVIPGWEDAYATPVATRPTSARRHDVATRPDEANRLGALAYQGWFGALPESVRESSSTTWERTPEPFREPLRQAAVLIWQHGENAGFHQALLRTLPAGQLGAAGELENIRDLIIAQAITDAGTLPNGRPTPPDQITVSLRWLRDQITERVAELRRQSAAEAKRARDKDRYR